MIKITCPYCGGRCETTGGPDGNPFNKDRTEKTVCTVCGRTVSEAEPLQIPADVLEELLTDVDIIEIDTDGDDVPDTEDVNMSISDIVNPPKVD